MKLLLLLLLNSLLAHAELREPEAEFRPRVRWWLPNANVSEPELAREIDEMRANGFGGAELSFLPTDPATLSEFGWGTPAWRRALETILRLAADKQFPIDLTLGPAWPLSVPGKIRSFKDPRAEQELAQAVVELPQEGSIPVPTVEAGESLEALIAARVESGTTLDPRTVNLTGSQAHGRVHWRAPRPGSWRLFAFWRRPTSQTTTRPVAAEAAPVLDHFSIAATAALTSSWENDLLSPPARENFRRAGGAFFGDSLELSGEALWTTNFLAAFRHLRGYNLAPFLPALVIPGLQKPAGFGVPPSPDSSPAFEFPNGVGAKIRKDYYRTLSQLMEARHLRPLAAFAKRLGVKLRYQPAYGSTLNLLSNARLVDIPETESLHSGNQLDYHRAMSSAARFVGHRTVSTECCANLAGDYGQTVADFVSQANRNFAGGVNQIVFHGRPYQAAGAAWPGWHPFSPFPPIGFSEAWDSRQPFWRAVPELTAYLARTSQALRSGEPRDDVAILRDSYWWPGNRWFFTEQAPPLWPSSTLTERGFTYGFVDPVFFRAGAAIEHGILFPGHGGYRALVIPEHTELSGDALRALAQRGLPVVFVRASGSVTGISLSATMRVARTPGEVPAALASLGIAPAAEALAATTLVSQRRLLGSKELFFFQNPTNTFAQNRFHLANSGALKRIDAWSGTSRNLGSGNEVEIALAPGDATLIEVGFGPAPPSEPLRDFTSVAIPEWELRVESWGPEGITSLDLGKGPPRDWLAIPALTSVSGVGFYHARVFLPPGTSLGGAVLKLGHVEGSALVRVNGHPSPAMNPLAPEAQLGDSLVEGWNDLEVEMASTLRNRLRALWQNGWEEQLAQLLLAIGAPGQVPPLYGAQPTGLIGPVELELPK